MAKVTTTLFGDLAFLPVPARDPVSETLEYLTDIIRSYNGTEQRVALRSKPRQTIAYSCAASSAAHGAEIFNTLYGAIDKRWAVPLWHQAQSLASVSAHQTTISCDTSGYDFRNGSLALLWQTESHWQIVEISIAGSGYIDITTDTASFGECSLMPVRLGWLNGSSGRHLNRLVTELQVAFEIDDYSEIVPATPGQYLGYDVFDDCPQLAGSGINRSMHQQVDRVDFDLGLVSRLSPWIYARITSPARKTVNGFESVSDYKRWFARAQGKAGLFWLPLYEVNLHPLNAGMITTTLIMRSDAYMAYGQHRKHIAVRDRDGEILRYREITFAEQVDAQRIQLTLSPALNLHINAIDIMSYLGLCRFDSDNLSVRWIGRGVAEITSTIIEIQP